MLETSKKDTQIKVVEQGKQKGSPNKIAEIRMSKHGQMNCMLVCKLCQYDAFWNLGWLYKCK